MAWFLKFHPVLIKYRLLTSISVADQFVGEHTISGQNVQLEAFGTRKDDDMVCIAFGCIRRRKFSKHCISNDLISKFRFQIAALNLKPSTS